MLRISRALALGGIFTLSGAAPALAQYDEPSRYRDQGFMIYGVGGGFSSLADINELGDNFDTGFALGAGIGYQINRHVALRGNLNFSRAQAQAAATPAIDGEDFNRYFYDADFQFRYPHESGLAPYAVVGGGAVTVDPDIEGMSNFTQPAVKVGAGVGYHFAQTGASLFAEWNGWLYDWDRTDVDRTLDMDKTQFDSTWNGGLRFTF